MSLNKSEIAVFIFSSILMLSLVGLVAWGAETNYGYGVAALLGGIVLMGIGNTIVHGRLQTKFIDAIRNARAKSKLWWFPYAGILVGFAGVIMLFNSADSTILEKVLSIVLLTSAYYYTLFVYSGDSSTQEPAV